MLEAASAAAGRRRSDPGFHLKFSGGGGYGREGLLRPGPQLKADRHRGGWEFPQRRLGVPNRVESVWKIPARFSSHCLTVVIALLPSSPPVRSGRSSAFPAWGVFRSSRVAWDSFCQMSQSNPGQENDLFGRAAIMTTAARNTRQRGDDRGLKAECDDMDS